MSEYAAFLLTDETHPKPNTMPKTFKSKTLAAALALVFGVVGAHRFYLQGWRDVLGWLHLPLFAVGVWGATRFIDFGENDAIAEIALPLLGLIVGLALFQALLIGLTPDARWDAKWNVGTGRHSSSGWGAVLVAVFALLIGTAALMGGLAFGLQHYFQPG
ncbi:NINE protein [Thiomonas sp.]